MRLQVTIAATLALAGQFAHAQQKVGDIYAVPQLGYGWPDDDRNADDDMMFGLAVGKHFSEAVSLELGVSRGQFGLTGGDNLDLTAYSIDALRVFARDSRVSPFVSVGAGALNNDTDGSEGHTYRMLQAGLGMMISVAESGDGANRFSLRPEVKARWAFPRDNDPQDKFLDYAAMLGFQFAFGSPRPAAPAPVAQEPAPPPPPAPPPTPVLNDSDGDGVFDDRDRCPNTPRGVAVDNNGCPRQGSATLQGVTFEYNSARLTAESRPVLDEVAVDLKKYPQLRVELQGHTDSIGSDAYNLKLSDGRAQSVRDYLISQGVGASQLEAKGYGEAQPIADNTNDAGRAENRRVVMRVIDNPGDVKVQVEAPK